MFIPRLVGNQCRWLIKHLCAWWKYVAKGKLVRVRILYIVGAAAVGRFISVLFIIVEVRVSTHSSFYTTFLGRQTSSIFSSLINLTNTTIYLTNIFNLKLGKIPSLFQYFLWSFITFPVFWVKFPEFSHFPGFPIHEYITSTDTDI